MWSPPNSSSSKSTGGSNVIMSTQQKGRRRRRRFSHTRMSRVSALIGELAIGMVHQS
jgi:hypothetical protein